MELQLYVSKKATGLIASQDLKTKSTMLCRLVSNRDHVFIGGVSS